MFPLHHLTFVNKNKKVPCVCTCSIVYTEPHRGWIYIFLMCHTQKSLENAPQTIIICLFHVSFYKTQPSQCKSKWWYAENFKSFENYPKKKRKIRKSDKIFFSSFFFAHLNLPLAMLKQYQSVAVAAAAAVAIAQIRRKFYESTNKRIIEQKEQRNRNKSKFNCVRERWARVCKLAPHGRNSQASNSVCQNIMNSPVDNSNKE